MLSVNEWLNEPGKENESLVSEVMFRLRCCIPAIVQSYDKVKNTVQCQPAIREKMTTEEGNVQYVQIPLLLDVPVVFPSTDSYGIKFPLKFGDEVLVIFSDLSIDNFWLKGNVQNPIESRRHDLSDGIAIPCNLSQKKISPSVNELTLYQNNQTIKFSELYKMIHNHKHTVTIGQDTYTTSNPTGI